MAASRRNRASRQNGEDENQRDRAFHRRHSLAISFDDSQKGGLPGLTCPRRPFRYSTDGLQTRSARARQASRRSWPFRSEEHTSELQSLMRISYAVFCLKKKKKHEYQHTQHSKPSEYTTNQPYTHN